MLILNPESKVIHSDNPTDQCNVPDARKDEGPKPRKIDADTASALLGLNEGYRLCRLCFGHEADAE